VERRQKKRADLYTHRVVELTNRAQLCRESVVLEERWHSLYNPLVEAAVVWTRISSWRSPFNRGVWQIAREVIEERSRSAAT
jgi:hypothetical protein